MKQVVATTQIYTHVMQKPGLGVRSPGMGETANIEVEGMG